MAKVSELYGSQYLNAADVPPTGYAGSINGVSVETLKSADGVIRKRIVLNVDGCPKPVVCNSGNANILADAFGDDTDLWADESVFVKTHMVNFGGQRVRGVLIVPLTVDDEAKNEQ